MCIVSVSIFLFGLSLFREKKELLSDKREREGGREGERLQVSAAAAAAAGHRRALH